MLITPLLIGLQIKYPSHFYLQGENANADANVLVNPSDDWCKQESFVKEGVARHLGQEKIDAVLNMAGIYVTESMVNVNRTTSAPISVLRYDVDKGSS